MVTAKSNHLLDQQVAAGLNGDFARGWAIAEELRQLNPHCNRSKFNRAWYEMMRGDLLEGLTLLDAGRWENAFGDKPLPTNKPIYRNEDLKGKNLLLTSEGGYGDEIINVRFAKDFADRGAKVTVTCDPSLRSVFARVPGVVSVVGHKAAPDVYHDFWVPGMSAARVLEYSYQKLTGEPYLFVDPTYNAKWKAMFDARFANGSRPRIGLRFFGNPKFEHEQFRKFPKEDLINAVGDRPWINLQKEETDLPLETWEDTLAVISQLDLVITSCTSVAHASAALGKETWVITPVLPYYIWALPGDKTPWYKTVTLFRQEKFGEWHQVFAKIKTALNEKGF
ncbi:glycosyltransferase family protein [Bdellovibrio reynosensis]|uniref:Uncharacterized protein n=1 Tax=Bdellovibrio reynosensis TaxID=2835041 RepID=A0ABY4C7N7_9BACT|nr:hypothetical protein [Bdellovibrio reynosensis]UOF00998.1 hypothetical protein MNR06_14955 [Bdellovibrio reynosensis]